MTEQNKDSLERPHTADGIKELDNPLPRWWVWLFNITIVFGVFYMGWIHLSKDNLLETELVNDLKTEESLAESGDSGGQGSEGGSNTSAVNWAEKIKDEETLKQGEAHYLAYCSPCHRVDLGGQIGPDLTNDHWMHGCTPDAIVKTITEGVPEKGMAAWAPILGDKKIVEVSAYILSKSGSSPENPKEIQGEFCQWDKK